MIRVQKSKSQRLISHLPPPAHYNKTSTKIDIIWQGEAIWEVNGKEIPMKAGDYLIIPSKTVVGVKKVLSEKIIVQTLRFPSIPDDKVMV